MKRILRLMKRCLLPLFVVYLVFLILVVLFKFPTGMTQDIIKSWLSGGEVNRFSPQLISFKTIIFYVSHVQAVYDWFFKNLAINIIMFFPFGMILPMIKKNKENIVKKVLLSGCVLSIIIEIMQYVTALGQCDIDDVILNTIGVILGVGVYKLIYKIIGGKNAE